MAIKEQLLKLAKEKNKACVTISFNTHRTIPDNLQDEIRLKNYIKEAEQRLESEFDKKEVSVLLSNLEKVKSGFEVDKNIESIHIFISNDTLEIIRSNWPVTNEGVFIDETFAIRSLIKNYNREEEYYILFLTQKNVHLYLANNDVLVREIETDDFPFNEEKYNLIHLNKKANSNEHLVKEFFNIVDKAVIAEIGSSHLRCVVATTHDNFNTLKLVADWPNLYCGHFSLNFNNFTKKDLSHGAWEIVTDLQRKERSELIDKMNQAVSKGEVLTDLQEIYQAALDGNADLLIVHQNFTQPVKMKDERTFDLADNASETGVIDDITSTIAWEVINKNGKAIFTSQDEIKNLGNIALKTRY